MRHDRVDARKRSERVILGDDKRAGAGRHQPFCAEREGSDVEGAALPRQSGQYLLSNAIEAEHIALEEIDDGF